MASEQKQSKHKLNRSRKNKTKYLRQWSRTAMNKLRRINRDRAKSGKPPLTMLKFDMKGTPGVVVLK